MHQTLHVPHAFVLYKAPLYCFKAAGIPTYIFILTPVHTMSGIWVADVWLVDCVFAEINRVRSSLFYNQNKKELSLPDAQGPAVNLQEKLYVPVKEHPDVSQLTGMAVA